MFFLTWTGTLWDASSACALAWTQTLEDLGHSERKVSAAEVRAFTGLTFESILGEFFPGLRSIRSSEVLERYQRNESEVMKSVGGTLFPGVEAVLRRLAEARRLFIVSNCLDGYIENFLSRTGLEAVFEGYESLGRSGTSKAGNIASVIRDFGLLFPIYVGDTVHDAEAAAKNQIPFVFAEYGFGRVGVSLGRHSLVPRPCRRWVS